MNRFDPGDPPDNDMDKTYDVLLAELKKADTGRWRWDRIHCCLTGKDDDLERWGQQGIELFRASEDGITFALHFGATIVGLDVCLNLPDGTSCEDYDKAREKYLGVMYEVVCGEGIPGEWDGDSWYLHDRVEITIPCPEAPDGIWEALGQLAYEAVIKATEPEIEKWEKGLGYIHDAADMYSGWRDAKGERCEAGKVPSCAAWVVTEEEA